MDASKVGGGPGGAAATSEGVLANFFNSLLSKKTGGAGGVPGSPGQPGGSPGGGGMGPNGQIMAASPGGIPAGSPGGLPGNGGGGQLLATGDNECEYSNLLHFMTQLMLLHFMMTVNVSRLFDNNEAIEANLILFILNLKLVSPSLTFDGNEGLSSVKKNCVRG